VPVDIRPFRRSDREQLTALVNAHAAAVVPGLSASVNAVMSQLEGEPGEFIIDPWVDDRVTIVAEQRGRVTAAAHLLRYADDDRVSDSYRDVGVIRWFLFWPPAPFWPDSEEAADALLGACVARLDDWGVVRQYADVTLPTPAVYGVPEQLPHIRSAFERAGFVDGGLTEILYLAAVAELPRIEPPLDGLTVRRSLGVNGTRFSAVLGGEVVGSIEVEALFEPQRLLRHQGWADIGNLSVAEAHRRRGVATWLLAQAADWLRLAGVDRLLGYASPENDCTAFFESTPGFRELTRTARSFERPTTTKGNP
jgi:GNAT superfamily N-acetyltransferase